ncbi:MAG: hypothetical protein LBS25_04290 [Candidatus Symbiothrix sp.]|jgi:hypothetical protein|nr:hypothetical protein [Candidatus Symbiothrix sp.]
MKPKNTILFKHEISLFVNPVITGIEPAATTFYNGTTGGDVNTDGFGSVILRQGTTATKYSSNVIIDAVRVVGEKFITQKIIL